MRAATIRTILALSVGSLLAVLTAACDSVSGTEATAIPTIVIETPTAAATASPTFEPTTTPTATVVLLPTPTPTPVAESSWQCDPSGGLTCFGGFTYIDMLNEQEGWVYGTGGIVLHYTTPPGGSGPVWQLDTPLEESLRKFTRVNADEGWGIIGRLIFHYQDGIWERVEGQACCANDLVMLDEREGWSVGGDGMILHYYQGEWQEVSSPVDTPLEAITMLNTEEGWAVGVQGRLLHYHDGYWEQVILNDEPLFLATDLHDVEFPTAEEGWAIGDAILHYQQGEWQVVVEQGHKKSLYDVDFVSADEAWAVGSGGVIYHYKDNQWTGISSPTQTTLLTIDMIDETEGWAAAGDRSTLLHYQDGSWYIVEESVPRPFLRDTAWLEDGTGWAVGDEILYYNGETWQQINSPVDDPDLSSALFAIDMVNSAEGWAIGMDVNTREGKILHYHQGQWQLVPSPATESLTDIDMINENEGWAVGWNAGILHYQDEEWQPAVSSAFSQPIAIDMVNENEGWAVNTDGAFLHYQDGIWEQTPPIIDDFMNMSDIDMVDEKSGWAVGNHVFRYQDGQWHQVDDPPVGLITVAALSADEVWASGRGIIVHYQNGQWQVVDRTGVFPIHSIKMLNENEGWAVGEGILHYTSGE